MEGTGSVNTDVLLASNSNFGKQQPSAILKIDIRTDLRRVAIFLRDTGSLGLRKTTFWDSERYLVYLTHFSIYLTLDALETLYSQTDPL